MISNKYLPDSPHIFFAPYSDALAAVTAFLLHHLFYFPVDMQPPPILAKKATNKIKMCKVSLIHLRIMFFWEYVDIFCKVHK